MAILPEPMLAALEDLWAAATRAWTGASEVRRCLGRLALGVVVGLSVSGVCLGGRAEPAAAQLQAACEGGTASSCTKLGLMSIRGEGVPKDALEAARMYRKACDGGDALGCQTLAGMFAVGQGVARDGAKAVELYQKAYDGRLVDADGRRRLETPERFFELARVLEVKVELPQSAWDELRAQRRDRLTLLEGDCLAEPFANPFTYFRANVEIDGVRREGVGIRRKGFLGRGSRDADRPSLKIHFNEYDKRMRLFGLNHLTLNNATGDASYISQCLAYRLYARAGVPACRCNFVHLTVQTDGVARDLGLYVNVETVDGDFLARHFHDKDGHLFKGTLSDFRTGFTKTFDAQTDDADRHVIDEMVEVLETVPDSFLVGRLEKLLDLERYLSHWAMEVLLLHTDGYSENRNNFFIYRERGDAGRIVFVPWDTEGTLRRDMVQPTSVFARTLLPRRLYLNRQTRDMYVGRLRALLDSVWDEQKIVAEIDLMEAITAPVVQRAGGNVARMRDAIEVMRQVTRSRRSSILAELSAGPPAWTEPLAATACHTTLGRIASRVSTKFGSLVPGKLKADNGSLSGTLKGATVRARGQSGAAGFAAASRERVLLRHAAEMENGSTLTLTLTLERSLLTGGTSIDVDFFSELRAAGTYFDAATGHTTRVQVVEGELTIEKGEPKTGAPVVTRIEGTLIQR